MCEQPAFAFKAAAIAGQRTVGTDHTVARNHDRNGIGAISETHGPNGFRPPEPHREFAVTDRPSGRNSAQRRPDLALKRGPRRFHAEVVDGRYVTREISFKRAPWIRP